MERSEMIEKAAVMRSRDRFGPMSAEELAVLPGTERELAIPTPFGTSAKVFEIRPDKELSSPAPLVINYHGGGFIKGRADRDKRYCCNLAQELSCIVWDVDYILAPEAPFPAAMHECAQVAQYAYDHAEEFGIDKKRIALAGHSAGGNLVAATLIQLHRAGSFKPCGALMEYFPANQTIDPVDKLDEALRADPFWVNRAKQEKEYTLFYCTEEQAKDPLCSPGLASDEDLASFPPCLVISAGKDSLRDETETFAARLVSLGIETTAQRIPESVHGFTINRTEGWERAVKLHCKFFHNILNP